MRTALEPVSEWSELALMCRLLGGRAHPQRLGGVLSQARLRGQAGLVHPSTLSEDKGIVVVVFVLVSLSVFDFSEYSWSKKLKKSAYSCNLP